MKALLILAWYVVRALGAAAALVGLVGLVVLLGGRRTERPLPAPAVVKSLGPTVQQLETLGQLTTTRVIVTDVLSAEGEGYRGVWLIKGEVLLACDLARAVVVRTDEQARRATIRLPPPRALSPRVDHEKTRTWSVEKATWLPWRWGDQDLFRDSAMYHAQKLIAAAASSAENTIQARTQAEAVIRKFYALVNWNVAVTWE